MFYSLLGDKVYLLLLFFGCPLTILYSKIPTIILHDLYTSVHEFNNTIFRSGICCHNRLRRHNARTI